MTRLVRGYPERNGLLSTCHGHRCLHNSRPLLEAAEWHRASGAGWSSAEALSAIGGRADGCGAAGIKALPGPSRAFAATQGAWRFFANPRVTLPKLVEPVRSLAREAVAESRSAYVLLVHDWSKLDYAAHMSKANIA